MQWFELRSLLQHGITSLTASSSARTDRNRKEDSIKKVPPLGTPYTVLRRIYMRRTKSLQDDCTLTPEALTETRLAKLRMAKSCHVLPSARWVYYPIEADVSVKRH